MNKNEFKAFCEKEFKAKGFKKYRNMFYLAGKDLMCGMWLQKSDYGSIYYVNFCYFIGNFNDLTDHPSHYDSNIIGRILVMSRKDTIQGNNFITALIEYEEYSETELKPYFNKNFEEKILPPIYQGKQYILDHIPKLYGIYRHKDEVLQELRK